MTEDAIVDTGTPRMLEVLAMVVGTTLAVAALGYIWVELGRPNRLDFFGLGILCIGLLGHVALITVRKVAQ